MIVNFLTASTILSLASSSKNVHKRQAYGDELILPAEAIVSSVVSGYAEEAPVLVQETAPYGAISSPYGAAVAVPEVQVVESGYRSKRQAYGDELVVPDVVIEENVVVPTYEEAAPVLAPAPVAAVPLNPYVGPTAAAVPYLPVVSSGYRAKRATSYVDEPIVPMIDETKTDKPDEEAKQNVTEEEVAALSPPEEPVDAAVEAAGYRVKRNIYGDELIVPVGVSQVGLPLQYAELETIAIDQGHYATLPMLIHSGYRSRARKARQQLPLSAARRASSLGV